MRSSMVKAAVLLTAVGALGGFSIANAPAAEAGTCSVPPYGSGNQVKGTCTGNTYSSAIRVQVYCSGMWETSRIISISYTRTFQVSVCGTGERATVLYYNWVRH